MEEARTLGINLPATLIELLAEVARMLDATLGTRLDHTFPAIPPADPENSSA
jgi:hypothetical protein